MFSATGSMFGLAYGDALGAPTEFLNIPAIVRRFGPDGPDDLLGNPARVTDDTQMAIAVGWALWGALARSETPVTPQTVEPRLRQRFVAWLISPDNNRAPGNTCLNACARLQRGQPWVNASVIDSKGCGANMRVTPVGLVPSLNVAEVAGVAQFQAAMTHGHPTALAASELTALATRWLRDQMPLTDLPTALRDRCDLRREEYEHTWLGELWRQAHDPDERAFIARGWDECAVAMDRLLAALREPDPIRDPCLITGAGWIAEEALATAVYCAVLFADRPVAALSRAALTSGDSDSIAALTGAFLGAAHGMGAWPTAWLDRIEYANQLAALGAAWD